MHVEKEDLKLYLTGDLATQTASLIEIHIGQCESCRASLALAVAELQKGTQHAATEVEFPDKRHNPRFRADEPVVIYVLSPEPARMSARLVEVSKKGVKIRMSQRLWPGALIQVHRRRTIVLAKMRYSVVLDDDFQIGAQIQDVIEIPAPHPSSESDR
jgi:hypothetical protein